MRPRAGLRLELARSAQPANLLHDRPAFVVAVVKVRGDPDPARGAPVDDESTLDQLVAGILGKLEVDANGPAATLRIERGVDLEPLLVCQLDEQRRLPL